MSKIGPGYACVACRGFGRTGTLWSKFVPPERLGEMIKAVLLHDLKPLYIVRIKTWKR